MDKIKRKHQFQIRKIPHKRFLREKTPEIYGLDVHSICLPTKNNKISNWVSVNCDHPQKSEEDFYESIVDSETYRRLYQQLNALEEDKNQQKADLQRVNNQQTQEIQQSDRLIKKQEEQKRRLLGVRDRLYIDIQKLRDKLTQTRDKNYNLRWEIYHQRGAHYMNVNGYSFLQNNEMTYEELLQMEEQMGNISKGLTEEQISKLDKKEYQCQQITREICCICYDQINEGEMITVLKCRHSHHCDCLKDWLLKQKYCPICKQQIIPN